MKKSLLILVLSLLWNLPSNALNVAVIQDASPAQIMDMRWDSLCNAMGHQSAIYPITFLDSYTNLDTTDILIYASGVDNVLDSNRIATITQFLQSGRKVYMQSEYDSLQFDTNRAFASIIRSFGSTFSWIGTTSGVLDPVNISGSLATDYTATYPLNYFWYGCAGNVVPDVESFLEYQGSYYGFMYCLPDGGGRIITTSDQDWINQNQTSAVDSLMINIIYNLSKTSYQCVATASINENNKQHLALTVFPNPNAGSFNITFHSDHSTLSTLTIVDLLGKVVYSEQIKAISGENKTRLENQNFVKGIYFLRITIAEKTVASKIIVD